MHFAGPILDKNLVMLLYTTNLALLPHYENAVQHSTTFLMFFNVHKASGISMNIGRPNAIFEMIFYLLQQVKNISLVVFVWYLLWCFSHTIFIKQALVVFVVAPLQCFPHNFHKASQKHFLGGVCCGSIMVFINIVVCFTRERERERET
mgnify:CR=1 FL=1